MKYLVTCKGAGDRLFYAKEDVPSTWTSDVTRALLFTTKREANEFALAYARDKAEVVPVGPSKSKRNATPVPPVPAAKPIALALDAAYAPITAAYQAAKAAVKALPKSRQRDIALTGLESSFARAIFAASGMHDPIGGDS